MSHYGTARAASNSQPDYVEDVLDDVRSKIAADDDVLREARNRRNRVTREARKFRGALRSFNSGSVAHGTVNDPVKDADAGVVLDRRTYPELGPDGDGEGPDDIVADMAEFVYDGIREDYQRVTYEITKRAILFDFHDPMGNQDPSVDLIVALIRKDEPGLWIPNTEKGRWDPSDPEAHTTLLNSLPKSLRVLRARVIRLVKAALHQDDPPVLISFNVEALALNLVEEGLSLGETLREFFRGAAESIAEGNTPDPAGVSAPIKLPDGVSRETAVRRLAFFGKQVAEALEHRDDREAVERALAEVFPEQLAHVSRSGASQLASIIDREGNSAPALRLALGAGTARLKTTRSYGLRASS